MKETVAMADKVLGFDFIFWGWNDWVWPRFSRFNDPREGAGIVWSWTINAGPFEIRKRRK